MATYASGSDDSRSIVSSYSWSGDNSLSATDSEENSSDTNDSSSGSSIEPYRFEPSASNSSDISSSAEEDDPERLSDLSRPIVTEIIQCKNWKVAFKTKWKQDTTTFKELIKEMPKVAELVLKKCKEEKVDITFDFNIDIDNDHQGSYCTSKLLDCWGSIYENVLKIRDKVCDIFRDKRNHSIQLMVDKTRKKLLDDPVTMKLIEDKIKFYSFWYISLLLLYIIFVIFLTSLALVLPNPQEGTCQAINSGQFGKLRDNINFSFSNYKDDCNLQADDLIVDDVCSNSTNVMECDLSEECGLCRQSPSVTAFVKIAAIVVFVMASLQLIVEVIQVFIQFEVYLIDYTNYVDLILIISSCVFSFSALKNDCACQSLRQWQIGSVAVFLAWVNLLLFLRAMPHVGIHIVMFEQILKTFIGTLTLAITLVVAFSLSFFMLFTVPNIEYARSPFYTPGKAHLKLMAMTTGEIDYNSLFHLSSDRVSPNDNISDIPFVETIYLLWILFLILMPILLSNLLTALAIYDVKEIWEQSEINAINLKVGRILKIEKTIMKIVDALKCVYGAPKKLMTYFRRHQQISETRV